MDTHTCIQTSAQKQFQETRRAPGLKTDSKSVDSFKSVEALQNHIEEQEEQISLMKLEVIENSEK